MELKQATAAGLEELKAELKKEFPKIVFENNQQISKFDGDIYALYINTGDDKKTGVDRM